MAIITSSIGTTSRDYSTLQSWEDALPANLVTDGNSYVGECYNDSEFSGASTMLTISGQTTDATHTITLTTATGQSFRDHASAATNPLNYDQTKGVGITSSVNETIVYIQTDYTTIKNLQIRSTSLDLAYSVVSCYSSPAKVNIIIDSCILVATGGKGALSVAGITTIVKNCALIGGYVVSYLDRLIYAAGGNFYNCTIVCRDSYGCVKAILQTAAAVTAKNCAIFGADAVNTGTVTYTTCYTDVASPPSGVTQATYANCFVNVDSDWRLKTGSDLIDTGTTDATNAPTDIIGTERPQGDAYDVGAWEFVAAPSAGGILQTAIWIGIGVRL